MTDSATIRSFMFSSTLVTEELRVLSENIGHALIEEPTKDGSDRFYDQFDQAIRDESRQMSRYYEVFYCLEKSARVVVDDLMRSSYGEDWLSEPQVKKHVVDEVESRVKKEKEEGITRRSDNLIDYTTFGELTTIISGNWQVFESVFSNKKAVERVMARLNQLRSPIAHCCPLAEDEVVRLRLTVGDWFRLME